MGELWLDCDEIFLKIKRKDDKIYRLFICNNLCKDKMIDFLCLFFETDRKNLEVKNDGFLRGTFFELKDHREDLTKEYYTLISNNMFEKYVNNPCVKNRIDQIIFELNET